MELIDRYLHAVRGFLPKRDQDDIVKELAEDIRSQIDDRETELGRPLTKIELEAFLKQMGHPMLLAARFQPQRYLVGPAMFPFYQRTLIIALGVALMANVVLAAALVVSGRPAHEIMDAMIRFPTTIAITVFGWVTIVFAVGEWTLGHTKVLIAWEPRTLAPVRKNVPQVSRLQVLSGIVGTASFLAYLLLLPAHPWLLFGPAALFLDTGPGWDRYYAPMVVLVSLSLIAPLVNLFRPDWTRLRGVSRLAFGVAGLALWSLMIDSGPYVILKAGTEADQYSEAVKMINSGTRIFLVVTWIITAVDLVREAVRFWRSQRQVASGA
jgi:hypothetical protein